MRFMMLVIAESSGSAQWDRSPDANTNSKMMKFEESLADAGVLRGLDELKSPSAGVRVSFGGGKPKVTVGPFAEAKECVGGYWMIQVESREEAIEWAKRAPMGDNELIELRQVQENP